MNTKCREYLKSHQKGGKITSKGAAIKLTANFSTEKI